MRQYSWVLQVLPASSSDLGRVPILRESSLDRPLKIFDFDEIDDTTEIQQIFKSLVETITNLSSCQW
jgi:hypothetical protein